MEGAKVGGDRQALHERIRLHAIKGKGRGILERLRNDGAFRAVQAQISARLAPDQSVGRAPVQVREFLREEVRPRLTGREKAAKMKSEVRV